MSRDAPPAGALSQEEFARIYHRVPRLTVEVVISLPDKGVLLALRDADPCRGTWNLPGGTVRFGERLTDAVKRVAKDEIGCAVEPGKLLGYIEYPSHYSTGLDSPVGLAFLVRVAGAEPEPGSDGHVFDWFRSPPESMHEEQETFLRHHGLLNSDGKA